MEVTNLAFMKDKVDNDYPLSLLKTPGPAVFRYIQIWIHKKYMKACSKVFENVLHNYTNKTEYICDCSWVGSASIVCNRLTKWALHWWRFCGGCRSTSPRCLCRWWRIVPQWKWAVAWTLVRVTLELSVPRVSRAGKPCATRPRTSVLG